MNIYTDKGLTRFINVCALAAAVMMTTFAIIALKAVFGW